MCVFSGINLVCRELFALSGRSTTGLDFTGSIRKQAQAVRIIRIARSLCWLLPGLMLAANGVAYAQEVKNKRQRTEPEIQKPAETDANEKLLRDAEALMKAGKPEQAYQLLEPFEFDRSGEVRFDYLIGIAALDSGKPDKATLAFERVLAVDPDYAGARLDLARAYYHLGDLQRAKTEFETVLEQNPSVAARATIQEYLDDIAARGIGKRTRISGYVEGTAGHDSNINNATETPYNVYIPTLYPVSTELPDNYYGVAAGGVINHNLDANWLLYAGADMYQRYYYKQNNFDLFDLEERAGAIYGTGTDRYRIGVSGGQNTLGGSRYYNHSGLDGDWRHAVDVSNQLDVFGQYMQYRYANAALQLNDINQLIAGAGWQHTLLDAKAALSGSMYIGAENDVGPATLSNPAGGRADGVKRLVGFRVAGQAAVADRAKLFFSAGEQFGNFRNPDPLISGQRNDRLGDLTVGMNWYLDDAWIVRPQLVRYLNTSNVPLYVYERNDISVTLRRNFK